MCKVCRCVCLCTWSRATLSSVAGCHGPVSFNTLHLLGWIRYLKVMDWSSRRRMRTGNFFFFPEVIFHEQSALLQTHPPPPPHVFTGYGQTNKHTWVNTILWWQVSHQAWTRQGEAAGATRWSQKTAFFFFKYTLMESSAISQERTETIF